MGWDPASPTEFEKSAHIPDKWQTLGTKYAKNFNPNLVWATIAKEQYNARSKASAIKHPAIRYLHRLLVYSCYGRTQIGQTSQQEIMALWLGLEPNDHTSPPLINYGEKWVSHWLGYRTKTAPRTKMIMGGGVTRLALELLGKKALKDITYVSKSTLLDKSSLTDGHHIIRGSTPGKWGWLVADKVWCELPNPRAGRKFSELRSKDPYGLPQDECISDAIPQPRPMRPPPGPSRGASSSSSTASPVPDSITLESLQTQFHAFQVDQANQTNLLYHMFSQGVSSGMYQPYLNYPHYPMQQGPLPGWENRQPTYPYHPHRPEGLDYRFSGGSDPRYDPNIPPLHPNQPIPDDYHSSVPPMEETWGSAPMPPWGDYAD